MQPGYILAIRPGGLELQRLPARYRGPFVLFYLEGKSAEEVAIALGRPRGTILSQLARARERLRVRLAHRGLALSAGVLATLLERTMRRTLRMGVHQALLQLSPVETRLLVLFWHLAERWGRVTPKGIVLPLGLTHQLLGQLVGCRRASVTTALKAVTRSGLVVRLGDGGWLLRGEPPD